MQNRIFSLVQDKLIEMALCRKMNSMTVVEQAIHRRFYAGEITTFSEADDTIRALIGEDEQTHFWDRRFSKRGRTIASALAPFLRPIPYSPSSPDLSKRLFKMLECPDRMPEVVCCPLSLRSEMEGSMDISWELYLIERLVGHYDALSHSSERILRSGMEFLQQFPQEGIDVHAVTKTDHKPLTRNFAITLTAAAIACVEADIDLWNCLEQALTLFTHGNQINGFQFGSNSERIFILTSDPCSDSRHTEPSRRIRSFTPEGLLSVPVPPPEHSSATDHAMPLQH